MNFHASRRVFMREWNKPVWRKDGAHWAFGQFGRSNRFGRTCALPNGLRLRCAVVCRRGCFSGRVFHSEFADEGWWNLPPHLSLACTLLAWALCWGMFLIQICMVKIWETPPTLVLLCILRWQNKKCGNKISYGMMTKDMTFIEFKLR